MTHATNAAERHENQEPYSDRATARSSQRRPAPSLSALSVIVTGVCLTMTAPAFSLEIIGNYIGPGQSFPNSSRIADSQHASSVGSGNVQSIFEAAATAWEKVIRDPWTVTINYGWDEDLTYAHGETFGIRRDDPTTGRITEANIRFRSDITSVQYPDVGWYLDSVPGNSSEYGPQQTSQADFGGGVINSGRFHYATELEPPKYSAVAGGAYPDLLNNAIHELGHALNVNTATLSASDSDNDGDAEISHGPYAGTEIAWDSRGGGHPDERWPDANMAMLGIFEPPYSHRNHITDLDAILVAEVSDFKRVALPGMEYVALSDFSDTSILTMNGDAQEIGDRLRLTPDQTSSAGSAFLTLPFATTPRTAFTSQFSFEIGGINGGGSQASDGFAFVIHGDNRGASALGADGGSLGFGDLSAGGAGIGPSVALEFDTHQNSFDSDGNHVAFIANGSVDNHLLQAPSPFLLNAGLPMFVWMDYDPLSDLMDVYLSDAIVKPSDPLFTSRFGLDLLSENVWFGFTAGTGGGTNYHDILSWTLEVFDAPEPPILSMFLVSLLGLLCVRKR